jgi:hypothetical protein
MLKSFAKDVDTTALFLRSKLRLEYDGVLITLSPTISRQGMVTLGALFTASTASSTDSHRCSSTLMRPVETLSKSIKLLTWGGMFISACANLVSVLLENRAMRTDCVWGPGTNFGPHFILKLYESTSQSRLKPVFREMGPSC